jgi:hypothetical protein
VQMTPIKTHENGCAVRRTLQSLVAVPFTNLAASCPEFRYFSVFFPVWGSRFVKKTFIYFKKNDFCSDFLVLVTRCTTEIWTLYKGLCCRWQHD